MIKKITFLILLAITNTLLAEDITIYQSRGGDFNLMHFPEEAISGKLRLDDTYFTAVAHKSNLEGILGDWFGKWDLKPEKEFQITKHYGLQDNLEMHSSLIFRSNNMGIVGDIYGNLAAGIGLSYALDEPTYEKEVDGKRYKLQNHLSFEAELGKDKSDFSIPVRIHHRSGVYGLIAPPKVGSNFISIGLRWKM